MLLSLILATFLVCLIAYIFTWLRYRDVFHPTLLIVPMCVFLYVYMPSELLASEALFVYVTQEQAEFTQLVIIATLLALFLGCSYGSTAIDRLSPRSQAVTTVDARTLSHGAYALGAIGMLSWMSTMQNVGGITNAFSGAKGMGWSDYGYVRDAVYLLIVALLLLLTPEVARAHLRDLAWRCAIVVFSVPWLLQGLLGARRGPTFLIVSSIAMSWYFARKTRPAFVSVFVGGLLLGAVLLLLVTNRDSIYIGSDKPINLDLSASLSEFNSASEANEYIFAVGCISTTQQTGAFYWGRRYFAQSIIRPIPRQLWPTKYEDLGVPGLAENGGVAPAFMFEIMGWGAVPGAAATLVADLWVEFYWLAVPVAGFIGWLYGSVWARAVRWSGYWTILYVISALCSIYLVTQAVGALLFQLLILAAPSAYVWHLAASKTTSR